MDSQSSTVFHIKERLNQVGGMYLARCMKLAIGLRNQCHNHYVTSVAGETQEITINFSPDHESPFYVDVLHIELNGQVHAFVNVYTLCLVPN